MGTYSMKVRFPVLELERGRLAIENTLSNYETACGLLKRLVITSHCTLLADDLKVALNNSRGINEFVKGFFPSRKSRGFITAIGGMDSDDRVRIDTNLDKLRKNEESIKLNLDHQTATIDAMYKFVDGSMVHLDGKLKGILENFDEIQK